MALAGGGGWRRGKSKGVERLFNHWMSLINICSSPAIFHGGERRGLRNHCLAPNTETESPTMQTELAECTTQKVDCGIVTAGTYRVLKYRMRYKQN